MPATGRQLNRNGKGKSGAARVVLVRVMDPIQLCGKGTTVTELYRVEEVVKRGRIHHLVFFDRHGWYCEHGKQCSAVGDVQRFIRSKH